VSLISRIFKKDSDSRRMEPLYQAIVATGRDPAWYRQGQVADTIDGRFDMITALLALVLLRLEPVEEAKSDAVLLTEVFINDMDGTLRQLGIGDFVVGKRVGKLVAALGGRLGAFRDAGAELEQAARHNIFHDAPPSPEALQFVSERLNRFRQGLADAATGAILGGELPRL
jgi:cytochrome b pre-mRNA-processing protein 3